MIPSQPQNDVLGTEVDYLNTVLYGHGMTESNPGFDLALDLFGNVVSSALMSPCGSYRYLLTRSWELDRPTRSVCWIMLNPSTANADRDDPTIRRCVSFTRAWGYGGIVVTNLFALRSTDSAQLAGHPNPVGPDNDDHLRAVIESSALVVCAWGAHRMARERAHLVRGLAAQKPLWSLGVTRNGAPRHPLYVSAATALSRWSWPAEADVR